MAESSETKFGIQIKIRKEEERLIERQSKKINQDEIERERRFRRFFSSCQSSHQKSFEDFALVY